jgi:hypothetical protein
MSDPSHTPPAVSLDQLFTHTDRLSDKQIEALGRQLYQDHCVIPARAGLVTTHDGLAVTMYSKNEDFVHAFYKAATKDRRGWAKDEIDPRRVARARWIVPVVGGQVAGTQCWRIVNHDAYTKPAPEKRLYVVRDETYVIWLLPRKDGGWRFKTAYVTGHGDINRYTERQRLLWER